MVCSEFPRECFKLIILFNCPLGDTEHILITKIKITSALMKVQYFD
jgi:hypothetical protein